ncbi:hypothetical protein ACIO8H_35790 [Streptomyces sp. NPDC087226]|jgi:hypothetical protein|uniref:hypothetical protein n=1 Tax=Streptomyces sp. NPDC087226 TaxID=3365771 RepID=UPI0038085664
MALKPEASILGGLAVAALVFGIHQQATPSITDIQALPQGTPDIERAEKAATWTSIVAVSGISLLARDPGIFLIGSGATIAMSIWTKNANWTESIMGRYLSPSEAASAGTQSTGPAPMETQPYEPFAQSQFLDS